MKDNIKVVPVRSTDAYRRVTCYRVVSNGRVLVEITNRADAVRARLDRMGK